MDTLELVFFESPFWLGVTSFMAFAIVLFARRRWTGPGARYTLPVTLAAITLLFVVQSLVTTQRERILESLDGFVAAIAVEDMTVLRATISRDYDSEGMNRAAIVKFIDSALTSMDIYDARYRRPTVTVGGDQAELIFAALATVRRDDGIGNTHAGAWSIGWAREPDGWKIVSILPRSIDARPVKSLITLGGAVR